MNECSTQPTGGPTAWAPPGGTGSPAPGAGARQHLLCIDDDPVTALLLQEFFRLRDGPAVVVAPSGRQGLALARSDPPLAVLLDLNLPDMHGLQVLAGLREDPATRHIPVAMVSGGQLDDGLQQALNEGADAVWPKPVDLRQMDRQLAQLLQCRPR